MNRTLADFARACGGELIGPDRAFAGVSSDTRTLRPGELFVALRGPRFNANEFVSAAAAAGAAGAVVDWGGGARHPPIQVGGHRDARA
jgi:UDP-N-acetylmuramoyl-tripeptide--D-alanyl-D-alanine ligase